MQLQCSEGPTLICIFLKLMFWKVSIQINPDKNHHIQQLTIYQPNDKFAQPDPDDHEGKHQINLDKYVLQVIRLLASPSF